MDLSHDDVEGLGPFGRERDAFLSLAWGGGKHFAELKRVADLPKTAAAMLLALYNEHLGQDRPVSTSLRRGHYSESETPSRYVSRLYQYRGVKSGYEQLAADGLAFADKRQPGERGWQSTLKIAPLGREVVQTVIEGYGKPKLERPACNVIIRDRMGRIIDKPLSREQWRMQRNLNIINDAIASADIPDMQATFLSRIFNETPDRGGRAYMAGGGIQSLKKEIRLRTRFDGEPVIEIDYKGLHPHLLYSEIGREMPEEPYELGGWPRDIVKRSLLVSINAKNERGGIGALAKSACMEEFLAANAIFDPNRPEFEIAELVVKGVKRLHAPIARFFHSDTGARLMRKDSDIAETVMLDMIGRGIVVLPIHDSFLVAASKADFLKEAMIRAAQIHGLQKPRLEVFSEAG